MVDQSIEKLVDCQSAEMQTDEEVKRPETPVDITDFLVVKQQKAQNKQYITIWYSEFERNNERKPTDEEAA